jgi:hypothetical protein
MKAENPLRGYLGAQRIKWDEGIDQLICNASWTPDEEPIGFCQMVGGWVDFTSAVREREVELRPGYYSLTYIGYGLTALYVVFGTKDDVKAKLLAAKQANDQRNLELRRMQFSPDPDVT